MSLFGWDLPLCLSIVIWCGYGEDMERIRGGSMEGLDYVPIRSGGEKTHYPQIKLISCICFAKIK